MALYAPYERDFYLSGYFKLSDNNFAEAEHDYRLALQIKQYNNNTLNLDTAFIQYNLG